MIINIDNCTIFVKNLPRTNTGVAVWYSGTNFAP
jgi:hypothetical protein